MMVSEQIGRGRTVREDGKGDLTDRIRLTEREFVDVIAYAGAILRYDEEKGDKKFTDSITKSLSPDGFISIQNVYEEASRLKIPGRYIERALAITRPSVEQQIGDIKKHGAIPSLGVFVKTYQRELLDALRRNDPIHKFDARNIGDIHIEVVKVSNRKEEYGRLFWKKTIDVKSYDNLAFLFFNDWSLAPNPNVPRGKFNLSIWLYDPSFLSICGETLERLNGVFKSQMHEYGIKYYYQVTDFPEVKR